MCMKMETYVVILCVQANRKIVMAESELERAEERAERAES